jgi:Galactose oxidase, central domain
MMMPRLVVLALLVPLVLSPGGRAQGTFGDIVDATSKVAATQTEWGCSAAIPRLTRGGSTSLPQGVPLLVSFGGGQEAGTATSQDFRVVSALSPFAVDPITSTGTSPIAMRACCAVFDPVEESFYVLGGFAGNNALDQISKFHFQSMSWDPVWDQQTLPAPKNGMRAVSETIFPGLAYLFGGCDGNRCSGVLSSFNFSNPTPPIQDVVTSGGDPASRMYTMIERAGPFRLVLFGGYSSAGANLDDTFVFVFKNEVMGDWTQIISPGSAPPSRRFGASAFNPTNNMFVIAFGIGDNAGRLDDIWAFDIGASSWTQVIRPTGSYDPGSRAGSASAGFTLGTRRALFVHSGQDAGASGDSFIIDIGASAVPSTTTNSPTTTNAAVTTTSSPQTTTSSVTTTAAVSAAETSRSAASTDRPAESSEASSSALIPVIIGCVVAFCLLVAVAAAGFVFWRRRQRSGGDLPKSSLSGELELTNLPSTSDYAPVNLPPQDDSPSSAYGEMPVGSVSASGTSEYGGLAIQPGSADSGYGVMPVSSTSPDD